MCKDSGVLYLGAGDVVVNNTQSHRCTDTYICTSGNLGIGGGSVDRGVLGFYCYVAAGSASVEPLFTEKLALSMFDAALRSTVAPSWSAIAA